MKKYISSALSTFRGSERTPRSDWHAMLLVFVAVMILALLADGLLTYKLLSSPEAVADPSTKPSLSREAIRSTVAKTRQSDAGAAVIPTAVLRDPSL